MYDIFYLGENESLVENLPFAKPISSLDDATPLTQMFWVVEPNVEILDYDVLDFKPPSYDRGYEHVWKCHKSEHVGIRLLPRFAPAGTKEQASNAFQKRIEILRKTVPGKYFDENPHASHVWCVDRDYKIANDLDWVPNRFEPDYIHNFHLKGQLEHKYPSIEGGVRLYPRNWKNAQVKYRGCLDNAGERYPVCYVDDVTDYTVTKKYTDTGFVWLVDRDHIIEESTLDWTPDPFEQEYVHCFRMPYQLTERYPSSQGGIRLVPTSYEDAPEKIHRTCPVEDKNYNVFYVSEGEFDEATFKKLSSISKTDWFWVVDKDYGDLNGKFLYVPEEHELEYIHVFKLPGHLDYRYDPDMDTLYDKRVSGIYLVNKNFDIHMQKLHMTVSPLRYDIFFVDEHDMNNYAKYSRLSKTKAFWLVAKEFNLTDDFKWVPQLHDQDYINIFKVANQLEHRYPPSIVNVSDNRCGGVKLVPADYNETQKKFQGYIDKIEFVKYEVFDNEEEGRDQTKYDWFWVVDPTVELLDSFALEYYPDSWDEGKTHVWQILNPVTEMQYDYGGVRLCPREPVDKGRPKYIRKPACKHVKYQVFYLEPEKATIGQLEQFDEVCLEGMYYVVDPYTELTPTFNFEYYPTQWDQKNVHVFKCGEDHTGIRIYPKGTFQEGHPYDEDDVIFNRFDQLKLLEIAASKPPSWPVEIMHEMTQEYLLRVLDGYRDIDMPFVWTVDNDCDVIPEVIQEGILPAPNKVMVWQARNPRTNNIQGYTGLRLWPTDIDRGLITTDAVCLNKIRNKQYVRKPGAILKGYDIVFLSYNEKGADSRYAKLLKIAPDAKRVHGVEGIFEAHKEAASVADTKMFWVVDGDASIVGDFDFSYIPDIYDQEVVHVWHSRNPITGLEYGYGGVKLFNREQVLDSTSWGLDFTTGLSSRFKVIPEVSCITHFNEDSWTTWRSAFRECVKLAIKDDHESRDRLEAWLHPVPDAFYRADAKLGAEAGKAYALANINNLAALDKINDFTWLKEQYDAR